MGALTEDELRRRCRGRADVAVWREGFRELCSRVAGEPGAGRVHVKHDSGMGRLGERDPAALVELARAARPTRTSSWPASGPTSRPPTRTGGLPSWPSSWQPSARSPRRSASWRPDCIVHAANSAATLRDPATHFDMVRCGIAIYGLDPFQERPRRAQGLEPALELHSYVADVKRFEAGASAGYGRTWRAPERHLGRRAADRLRRRRPARALQQRRGAGRRPPLPAGRHGLDGQHHDRPRPRDRRRARRAGGADRRPGRGADPRRGGRAPARHDQLRGHLRDLRAGARARSVE